MRPRERTMPAHRKRVEGLERLPLAHLALVAQLDDASLPVHEGQHVLLPGVQHALGRVRAPLDDEVAVRVAAAERPRRVHPADPLEHEGRHVEVDGDLLLLREHRLLEVELALVPLEDAEDDLADLGLHRPPQLVRGQRPHLHEDAALPAPEGEGADRRLVLLRGDLALAQQHLAETIARQVARGEDHAAGAEVQGLARAAGGQGQDAGRTLRLQLAQQVGQGQPREGPPQSARHGKRLEALGSGGSHRLGGRRSRILGARPTGVKDGDAAASGRPAAAAGRPVRRTPV